VTPVKSATLVFYEEFNWAGKIRKSEMSEDGRQRSVVRKGKKSRRWEDQRTERRCQVSGVRCREQKAIPPLESADKKVKRLKDQKVGGQRSEVRKGKKSGKW